MAQHSFEPFRSIPSPAVESPAPLSVDPYANSYENFRSWLTTPPPSAHTLTQGRTAPSTYSDILAERIRSTSPCLMDTQRPNDLFGSEFCALPPPATTTTPGETVTTISTTTAPTITTTTPGDTTMPVPTSFYASCVDQTAHNQTTLANTIESSHQPKSTSTPPSPSSPSQSTTQEQFVLSESPTAFKPPAKGEEKCVECGATETPEWRKGPLGRRTLCNRCGIRYSKMIKRQLQQKRQKAQALARAEKQRKRKLAAQQQKALAQQQKALQQQQVQQEKLQQQRAQQQQHELLLQQLAEQQQQLLLQQQQQQQRNQQQQQQQQQLQQCVYQPVQQQPQHLQQQQQQTKFCFNQRTT